VQQSDEGEGWAASGQGELSESRGGKGAGVLVKHSGALTERVLKVRVVGKDGLERGISDNNKKVTGHAICEYSVIIPHPSDIPI
jgi:hypothetical protein